MQKFTPKFLDVTGSDNPKPETFGSWLRRCREVLGVSRRVFAERANISECDLRNIETVRRLPTAEQRMRLIQAIAKHDTTLLASVPPG